MRKPVEEDPGFLNEELEIVQRNAQKTWNPSLILYLIESEIDMLLVEDKSCDAEMTVGALTEINLADKLLHDKNKAETLDFIFAKVHYAARQSSRNPKVILLDLEIPRADSIEKCKRIRPDERTRTMPVVVLTSSK